jgi:hypothetical protein
VNTTEARDPVAKVEELERDLRAVTDRLKRLEDLQPPRVAPLPERARVAGARLETQLGTYWLSRLGILTLISGVALLITTYFGQLGVLLRISLGYAIAAAVAVVGLRLAKRHRVFGQVVFGGGLAVGYFVNWALHFVQSMRVIESEVAGIALVACSIAAIVFIAHRMQSETVAGIALYLALHTGMLSEVTALTLVCTTLLAVGAVFFLAANRWVIVPLSSIVAVYTTHATWAWTRPPGDGADLSLSLGFLAVDFVLFASVVLVRPTALAPRSSALLALLNWIGLAALGSIELWGAPAEQRFSFLMIVAVANGELAVAARLRRAPELLVPVYVALALVTVAVALPVKFSGLALTCGWAVVVLAIAAFGARARIPVFGWMAACVLGAMLFDASGVIGTAIVALAAFASERLQPKSEAMFPRALLVVAVGVAAMFFGAELMPEGLRTLSWTLAAFALFGVGFALSHGQYRAAGFGVLALATGRLFVRDLLRLSANERILTLVVAGALLLSISFIYTHARAQKR